MRVFKFRVFARFQRRARFSDEALTAAVARAILLLGFANSARANIDDDEGEVPRGQAGVFPPLTEDRVPDALGIGGLTEIEYGDEGETHASHGRDGRRAPARRREPRPVGRRGAHPRGAGRGPDSSVVPAGGSGSGAGVGSPGTLVVRLAAHGRGTDA